ncbi:MAG: DUF4836 family protein [Microscillaceae bacterium]|nr:DUF4836 family protein [Microscillaceae bacterium]MDW8459579.1 DUF4836 family protein [Cytophagales bacterium]
MSNYLPTYQIFAKLFFYTSFLSLALTSFTSCSKTTHSYRIPKETPIVAKMNSLRIFSKMKHAKNTIMKEIDEIAMRNIAGINLFDELRNSGISFVNIYGFGDLSPKNKNGYFALAVALKNYKHFEDFLKVFRLTDEIQQGNNYLFIERERTVLAWNTKELIFMASDSTSNRDLKKQMYFLMNLKPTESLPAQNPNFVKFQQHKADLGLWLNLETLASENPIGTLLQNINLKENYLHALANFGHGEVHIKTDYFLDKSLAQPLISLFKGNINRQAFANFSIGVPMGYIQLKVDILGLQQFLKKNRLFTQIQETMQHAGMAFEEFMNMFTGDVIFAVKNIRKVRKSEEYYDEKRNRNSFKFIEKNQPDFALGLLLKNEAKFDTLLNALIQDNALVKEDEGYLSLFRGLFLVRKNNAIYFTDNESIAKDLAAIENTQPVIKEEHLHLHNTPIWVHLNRYFFEKIHKFEQEQKAIKNKATISNTTNNNPEQKPVVLEDIKIRVQQIQEKYIRSYIDLKFTEKENMVMYIYQLFKKELQKIIQDQQAKNKK